MSRFKAVQSTFGTKCLRNGGNMGELMQQYIDEAEQDLLHTYNPVGIRSFWIAATAYLYMI